jgi:hypothetical protein
MVDYNIGVSKAATYQIKPLDSDYFNDDLNPIKEVDAAKTFYQAR